MMMEAAEARTSLAKSVELVDVGEGTRGKPRPGTKVVLIALWAPCSQDACFQT